jgi:hypothetical protein
MICSNPRGGGRASFITSLPPPIIYWAKWLLQGGWLAWYRISLPVEAVTSVDCSFHAQFWNVRLRTVIAAWLASNAPWPWHGHSCRENPRRNGVTLRQTRDVPPPCCARLSFAILLVGRLNSAGAIAASIMFKRCFNCPLWLRSRTVKHLFLQALVGPDRAVVLRFVWTAVIPACIPNPAVPDHELVVLPYPPARQLAGTFTLDGMALSAARMFVMLDATPPPPPPLAKALRWRAKRSQRVSTRSRRDNLSTRPQPPAITLLFFSCSSRRSRP